MAGPLPGTTGPMEIIFQEDGLLVKNISTPEETHSAMKLRHQVFREELRWVPPSPDGSDLDAFDQYAHGIGVFCDGELVGHVRLIQAPDPFMIEHDFSSLLPSDGSFRKRRGMAESTRICIKKDFRSEKHNAMTLVHLLYKAMYHWSRLYGSDRLITIVERRYYVLLKRSSFPFEQIGEFKPLGEGVMSGIISLDWKEFDEVISRKRPEFFEWFNDLPALTSLPGSLQAQSLSHAPY